MELTAIALWLNTAFAGFDASVATAIHKLYEIAPWFFTPLLTFITYCGAGGILLMAISAVLIVIPRTRRYGTCILLSLGVGVILINVILKPMTYRPRPYTIDGSIYQQYWIMLGSHMHSDYCFPSGHTAAAMEAALGFFLSYEDKRRGALAFLFVFLMGVSRIYLSVHYCTDVIGGILAGGISSIGGYFLMRSLPRSYYRGEWIHTNIGKKGKHCK